MVGSSQGSSSHVEAGAQVCRITCFRLAGSQHLSKASQVPVNWQVQVAGKSIGQKDDGTFRISKPRHSAVLVLGITAFLPSLRATTF